MFLVYLNAARRTSTARQLKRAYLSRVLSSSSDVNGAANFLAGSGRAAGSPFDIHIEWIINPIIKERNSAIPEYV